MEKTGTYKEYREEVRKNLSTFSIAGGTLDRYEEPFVIDGFYNDAPCKEVALQIYHEIEAGISCS